MLRFLLFRLALLAFTTTHTHAMDAPSTQTILTVTGAIDHTNVADTAQFDRAMLEALDWREIVTHTSFTDGPQRFAGPTLASLLAALGVEDGMLRASAVNDYTVEIPVAHATAHDVLLALDHNGRRMRVRDKGPVWIVYPLGREEALEQPFDSEMIWQLTRIHVGD